MDNHVEKAGQKHSAPQGVESDPDSPVKKAKLPISKTGDSTIDSNQTAYSIENTTEWCEPTPSSSGGLSKYCRYYLRIPVQVMEHGKPEYKIVKEDEMILSHITWPERANDYEKNGAFKNEGPPPPGKSQSFQFKDKKGKEATELNNAYKISFWMTCSAEHAKSKIYGNVDYRGSSARSGHDHNEAEQDVNESCLVLYSILDERCNWYWLEVREFTDVIYHKILVTLKEFDSFHKLTKKSRGEPLYQDEDGNWQMMTELGNIKTSAQRMPIYMEFVILDEELRESMFSSMSPEPFFPTSQVYYGGRPDPIKMNTAEEKFSVDGTEFYFNPKSTVEVFTRLLTNTKAMSEHVGNRKKTSTIEAARALCSYSKSPTSSLTLAIWSIIKDKINLSEDKLNTIVKKNIELCLEILKRKMGLALDISDAEDEKTVVERLCAT